MHRSATSYADYAGLNDPVIDVAITPNRQDCMGVRGIARDLAAAGLGTLKPLAVEAGGRREARAPTCATDDPAGCPAFYAQAVTGVDERRRARWMRRRLRAIGQKPISALVDITNYVTVDLGRPLHVYDKAKLTGGLVARKATRRRDGARAQRQDLHARRDDDRHRRRRACPRYRRHHGRRAFGRVGGRPPT